MGKSKVRPWWNGLLPVLVGSPLGIAQPAGEDTRSLCFSNVGETVTIRGHPDNEKGRNDKKTIKSGLVGWFHG